MPTEEEEGTDGFVLLDKAVHFELMQARIPETPPTGDAVAYTLHVGLGDNQRWVVEKRFTDFRALVAALRSTCRATWRQIPPLPPTHYFRTTNRDPLLLEERRVGLNAFLDRLLQSELAQCAPVLAFLEVPKTHPFPSLSPAALQRLRSGFRWTCLSHALHFRKAQPYEKLNGSFVEPFPHEPESAGGREAAAASSGYDEDVGFKMPNVSLSSQSWLCTGVNPNATFHVPGETAPDADHESPEWQELSAFHFRGLSHFNLNRTLRCGTTRFKAHFKKDANRVRVAMNPIALYMDSSPCPQAFLGSGVLLSSDDVQISRGLVLYDPRSGADGSPEDRGHFLLLAPFRTEPEGNYRAYVQLASNLRCKTQDARSLFRLMKLYDPQRATELLLAAMEESTAEAAQDFEIGSWVDLDLLQRTALTDETFGEPAKDVAASESEASATNGASPVKPVAVEMPQTPPPALLPVHLRVVDRDLSILLSFTVFQLLLRRWAGACEVVFLGANEFVALRGSKFSLHTWDAFREREERDAERKDEDSPRSLFTGDPAGDFAHVPPFTFQAAA